MTRQLVSYPKSGRTRIRYALHLVDADTSVKFHHDGFEFNDAAKLPHDFDCDSRLAKYRQVERVVYLERDPRDVLVSLYHQVTGRFKDFFGFSGGLSEFIRDDYFGCAPLHQFRQMWDRIADLDNVLRVSYEECCAHPAPVLSRILSHFSIVCTPEETQRAADESAFERMKEVEKQGTFSKPWLRLRNDAPKVREGRAGGYRTVLSEEDIAYLNNVFQLGDSDLGADVS